MARFEDDYNANITDYYESSIAALRRKVKDLEEKNEALRLLLQFHDVPDNELVN